MNTVCFTGHRSITPQETGMLEYELDLLLQEMILKGAKTFRCGGALGFDTLAAQAVLRAKEKNPHICLELVLPCPEQDKLWDKNSRTEYRRILSLASQIVYISPSYYNGVLQVRNRRLVEGADVCVAYCKNSQGGGTAFTCAYALSKGLELINFADKIC